MFSFPFSNILCLARFSPWHSLLFSIILCSKKVFRAQKVLPYSPQQSPFLFYSPYPFFFIRGSRIISGIIEQTNFTNLIQKINYFIDGYITHLATMFNLDQNFIETKINSLLNFLGNYLSNNLGNLITENCNIFLMGFITLLSLYFFLSQKKNANNSLTIIFISRIKTVSDL